MRKLITLFLLIMTASIFSYSQTQRLVLIEEATNASCGPCASQNPGFDALLNQNRNKLTAIKYHWYFPGNDPMHNHNVLENNARVAYYGINGVPTATIDGVIPSVSGYPGSPGGYTQTLIDQYAAVESSFEIDMNHYFSPNEDSIYVTMRIRAVEDISGIFVAQIVVIEKAIHFTSPPGSNGEKDFYDVMKKMLPDQLGTKIMETWETGDYIIIKECWKLENIYDFDEIGVVGFIQHSANKSVKQAANSSTEPLVPYFSLDASITAIGNMTENNCMGYVNPIVTINNYGADEITSLNINLEINEGEIQTFYWTGNLAFLESQDVLLPEYSFNVEAENNLKVYVSDPNSSTDDFPKNDTLTKIFDEALLAPEEIQLMIRLDTNPEEITWEITDAEGETVFSGGPYSSAGGIINEPLLFENSGCYTFTIFDEGGDGLIQPGFFALFYGSNEIILMGTNFGAMSNQQFSIDAGSSQTIDISPGFQFVSSHIYPGIPDMEAVVSEIVNDDLMYVRNSEGAMLRKIGPNWVNGIGDWLGNEGYLIKYNGIGQFTISGDLIPATCPIDLTSGFQFVSYLPTVEIDASDAFASIIGDELLYVRNSEGAMLRKIGPNWVNGIGNCVPNEGYLIKMTTDAVLVYPEGGKTVIINRPLPKHFQFEGGNAADPVYTIYVSGLEIGDEIAAFDGEVMTGALRINSKNTFENELAVFSTLFIESGFQSGNPIILKIFDNVKQSIVETKYTLENISGETYMQKNYPSEDGLFSIINITKSSASLAEETLSVYPNPASDLLNINSNNKILNVKILNYTGQFLTEYKFSNNEITINTSDYNSGIYFIQIETIKGISMKKLVIK
ncbi:MAG: T9SS type A sorting domain-containing protein [Bacteroidales bacterium]|nr:T9SS type A sorting domain-containing protein [Bacteroidales bacterium]